MSGERSLKRNSGGLAVADLSDENDVRVLAQNRSEGRRERKARLLMDLYLNYSRNAILHRVFDCDDVDTAVQEQPERGIKGSGLSGARRSGDKNQSFAHFEESLHSRTVDRIQPERFHRAECGAGVEDANHDFLPVRGWQRRDAQVHAGAVDRDPRAPTLRPQAIGDVHLGHDLDARDKGNTDRLGKDHHLF